jgi:hypothetical protein
MSPPFFTGATTIVLATNLEITDDTSLILVIIYLNDSTLITSVLSHMLMDQRSQVSCPVHALGAGKRRLFLEALLHEELAALAAACFPTRHQ